MEILEKAKIYLPGADEITLTLLIEDATVDVINYCNLAEYNTKLDAVIVKIVIQNYNKLKVQGISSEGFSGVTQVYTDGYTKDVLLMLNKNRKVKTL